MKIRVDEIVYGFLGTCFIVSWVGFRALKAAAEEGAAAIDEVWEGPDDET